MDTVGPVHPPSRVTLRGMLLLAFLAVAFAVTAQAASAGTFEYVSTIGQAGSGNAQFYDPVGVAVGSGGVIYVSDASNVRIQQLDAAGNFIRSWNTGVGGAAFSGLAGIATAPDGSVWVAEVTAKRLQHFSATGAYIEQITGFGSNSPTDVAVSSSGIVYALNNATNEVWYYSGTTKKGAFGGSGSIDGKFSVVSGVAASASAVFACDYTGGYSAPRVQAFSPTGTFVRSFGTMGSYGPPQLLLSVAAGPNDTVFAADGGYLCVIAYAADGTYLGRFGHPSDSPPLYFGKPVAVAAGSDGYVYVADQTKNCVVRLKYGSSTPGPGPGPTDVSAPVPSALKNVTVKKGKTAKMKYKVRDSDSTTCTVTIKVRNRKGKVVKTLKQGTRKIGKTYTAAFKCKLRTGAYKWYVYATDAGGNAQAKPGVKKLIVKKKR